MIPTAVTISIYTPLDRIGPGMRIGIQSDASAFDEIISNIWDPVSSQVLCAAQFQSSTSLPLSTRIDIVFGTLSSDGSITLNGDMINGKGDSAAVELHSSFLLASSVVDTRTDTGLSWDPVSGLFALLAQLSGGDLSSILAAVTHTY
jgi:hypothetical protein